MNYTDVYRDIREGTAGQRLPGQVVDAMAAVAQGSRAIAAVRHPLGFFCLPVTRHGGYGICVHIWTGQLPEVLTTSPMHSHSWDLLSQVLYGEVRNHLVHISDAPATPSHRVFEVHSDGNSDEIRRTPRLVRPAPGTAQRTAAGGCYGLAAGQFHLTVVAEPAATVVLGRSRPGERDLSLGNPGTPTHRVRRQRCGQPETMHLASALADRMNKSSRRSG